MKKLFIMIKNFEHNHETYDYVDNFGNNLVSLTETKFLGIFSSQEKVKEARKALKAKGWTGLEVIQATMDEIDPKWFGNSSDWIHH